MGLRGPAPTPTKILQARGSWRAKDRKGEAAFPPGKPTRPEWLSVEARAEWSRQVKSLAAAGVLCQCDRAALAIYCHAWGEFVWIVEEIKKATTPDADGKSKGMAYLIAMGLLKAQSSAAERVVKMAAQFGFTPSARSRIKAQEQSPAESSSGKKRFFNSES